MLFGWEGKCSIRFKGQKWSVELKLWEPQFGTYLSLHWIGNRIQRGKLEAGVLILSGESLKFTRTLEDKPITKVGVVRLTLPLFYVTKFDIVYGEELFQSLGWLNTKLCKCVFFSLMKRVFILVFRFGASNRIPNVWITSKINKSKTLNLKAV